MTEQTIQLEWLGHSCFRIEADGYGIVIDPYEDHNVPGLTLKGAEANQVLCSHEHHDHNARDKVKILPEEGKNPWDITALSTWHDDQQGALRGENLIHILKCGELRIVHLGDLGCELTQEQLEQLKEADVLLIPVGGFYTIDAAQAKALTDQINPCVTIPMHYRGDGFGYDVIGTVEEFLALSGPNLRYDSGKIEIKKGMPHQVAVLQCPADQA